MKFEEIEEEQIINMAFSGEKISNIARKFHSNDKTIREVLYRSGYKYDKKLKIWYHEQIQRESIYVMLNCDIEEEIMLLSKNRYYERYVNLYPDNLNNEKKQKIEIFEDIYKEIEILAEEYGADFPEELIELILLRFLDKNKKINKRKEFDRKYLKEQGYDTEEIKILMKYLDKDMDFGATAFEESMYENENSIGESDEKKACRELREFYIEKLKEKEIKIDIKNIDLFELKKVYSKSTGNIDLERK